MPEMTVTLRKRSQGRQEEEERSRATIANDAARSALGLLIHYTCMSSDNFRSPLMSLFKFHFRRCKILEVVCIVRGQKVDHESQRKPSRADFQAE